MDATRLDSPRHAERAGSEQAALRKVRSNLGSIEAGEAQLRGSPVEVPETVKK